jgi:transcriptional regulator with XRE-family HTH domain
MERFGQKLQILRERNGMSQEQLAQTLGFSRAFVSKLERGIKLPNAKLLVKIARLFQVSLDDLALDERDV